MAPGSARDVYRDIEVLSAVASSFSIERFRPQIWSTVVASAAGRRTAAMTSWLAALSVAFTVDWGSMSATAIVGGTRCSIRGCEVPQRAGSCWPWLDG